MEVMFWIWVVAAVLASAGVYLILWSTLIFPIHTMTPVWVFPAYPLLITAPFGGNLINSAAKVGNVNQINSLLVAMSSLAVQGMGFSLSFMVLSAFVYRLMTQKLPRDPQRPGVFISIGPSGFTVAGIGKHHPKRSFSGIRAVIFIFVIYKADPSSLLSVQSNSAVWLLIFYPRIS